MITMSHKKGQFAIIYKFIIQIIQMCCFCLDDLMLGIQQVKEILRAKWTGGSITPQGSNQPIQEPSVFINQSYENVGSDLVRQSLQFAAHTRLILLGVEIFISFTFNFTPVRGKPEFIRGIYPLPPLLFGYYSTKFHNYLNLYIINLKYDI